MHYLADGDYSCLLFFSIEASDHGSPLAASCLVQHFGEHGLQSRFMIFRFSDPIKIDPTLTRLSSMSVTILEP